MTGPYIVTTKQPSLALQDEPLIERSRRAVATLDEAMDYLCELVLFAGDPDAALPVDESGGTVGPLPDGTVIEVEATTRLEAVAWLIDVAHPRRDWAAMPDEEFWLYWIDAYNARHDS